MGERVVRPRVAIGRAVALLRRDDCGIEIEGAIRLSPGRTVDVVGEEDEAVRMAVVWTWTLVSLGREGPRYRGICRWV